MRGRVHVDLDGALSDFNAMCADKTPATRDLTEPERFVMDSALKDAGCDIAGGSECEPVGEPDWWGIVGALIICAAMMGATGLLVAVAVWVGWPFVFGFAAVAALVAAAAALTR